MKKFTVLFCLCFSWAIAQDEIINLYPSGAPGLKSGAKSIQEESTTGADGVIRVRSITNPTLTVYKANPEKNKGAAVIICPGGGYYILAVNIEGYSVAEWFAKNGITAFVLKYRLPQDELFTEKKIRPLQDAQQALRIVRKSASGYGIDPEKIGIMGFSAGGHLAATASTHFSEQVGEITEDGISVRPNFSILIYPVVSFREVIGHSGSKNNLIGEKASFMDIEEYSNELHVNKDTPPSFLVHAIDDPIPVENSLEYIRALKKNGVAGELHLYDEGGHGFGLADKKSSPVSTWPDRLKEWLKHRFFI